MSDEKVVARAIPVNQIYDPVQLRKDIAYSLVDLSNAMQEQAGFRLHYGELRAKATRQVDDFKILLEAAESKVYRRLRDAYVEEGKKITEALLDKEVAADPRILQVKRAINEAKQIQAVLNAAFEAFGDRKDMLVQLGAKDRVELQGELKMAAAAAVAGDDARGTRILEKQRALRGAGDAA